VGQQVATRSRSNDKPPPADPPTPAPSSTPATAACGRLFDDLASLVSFTLYLRDLVARVVIPDVEPDDQATLRENVFTSRFGAFSPLLLEMVLTRGVDSFLTYLSELFSLVFRSRPETLRSREQIRVEDVLEHESMDEVVAFLSERRVGRLAYAGLRDLAKEVESDLGLALFPEPGALDRAVSIVEARNLNRSQPRRH
jgi:hypothetical protein